MANTERDPLWNAAPFPLARDINPEDLRGESISTARVRLFPGWWVYQTASLELDPESSPYYSVPCVDEIERKVAEAVQPPFVRADFILPEDLPQAELAA